MVTAEDILTTFLNRTVVFSSGRSYELLKPLTDYRTCHDGTPLEARIVFSCRQSSGEVPDEEYVMKIKVQLPGAVQPLEHKMSTTTAHELKALTVFRDAKLPIAPQLIDFHQQAQDERGPFPGGFLTFTVMTKMPGYALFGKYWNMPSQQRDEILPKAVQALRLIYQLGIEPVDRGLRNVIWDPDTKHCSIIDFELWNEVTKTFPDEKTEMQRWGLLRTPPAANHWAAWNQMYG